MKTLAKKMLRKIGLVTAKDYENLDSGWSDFASELAIAAKLKGCSVFTGGEFVAMQEFRERVFLIGDRNHISDCDIHAGVSIAPQNTKKIISNCRFFS